MTTATIELQARSGQIRTATRDLQRLEQQGGRTDRTAQLLTRTLGALGAALSVQQVLTYADGYTEVQNRLKVVTDTSEDLIRVQAQLLELSNETRSSLEATAVLYSRTARATEELNISEERLLGIVETINKSFALSGATAQEASNAIRQLSQGLAAGALRGEEFNSVAEQAPEILRAVSRETGLAIGELREFAATGGITAELLIRSLENYSDEVERAFNNTERTFGQSLVVARNNAIQFVGELNESSGAVQTLGNAVVGLSENLDALVEVGQIAVGIYGAKMVGSLAASTAAKARDTVATVAQAQAERAASVATLESAASKARASAIATAATLRETAAAKADALQKLQNIRIAAQRTTGFYTNATAVAQLAAAEKAATVAAREHAVAKAASAAAINSSTVAANTAVAAQTRLNAAQAAGSITSRALTGALSLIGGPVGLVALTAFGIYKLSESYRDNTQAAEERLVKLREEARLNALLTSSQEAYNAAVNAAYDPVERYADAQQRAFAESLRGSSQQEYQQAVDQTSRSLELAEARLARLNDRQGVSAGQLQLAQAMVGKYKDQLEVLKDIFPELTTSEEKAAEAISKVTTALENELFLIRSGQEAYDIMIAQRRAGVEATSEEGQQIAALVRQRNVEQAALDQQIEQKREEKRAREENARAAENEAERLKEAQRASADRRATRIADLEQEIQLQGIRNTLGNDEYEIRAAIAALGSGATTEEQQRITNLVTQMQALRREAELLGPSLEQTFTSTISNALGDISNSLAGIIVQGGSMREVFGGIATTIATELLGAVIRYGIQQALVTSGIISGKVAETAAVTGAIATQTTAAVAAQGTLTATAVGSGAAIAAAMAPAAAASSIATAGGAPAAATPITLGSIAAIVGALTAGALIFGRATGGQVRPGTPYMVGERGPELFTPNGSGGGRITPFNQLMDTARGNGSSDTNVLVNVQNYGGEPVSVRDRGFDPVRRQQIVEVMVGEARPGTKFMRALSRNSSVKSKVE